MRLNKFLSGLAAVLLAFSLCNAASATPLTKIRTAWMDSYETFAMWYAKEKDGTKRPVWISTSCSSIRAWPSSTPYPQANGSIPASAGSRP